MLLEQGRGVAFRGLLVGGCCFVLLAGCGGSRVPEPPDITYAAFVSTLSDPARPASLDVPGTTLISSYDPSGGNNDFNNFQGREGEWAVLADVEGPGYVSRFWTTGGASAEQRLRFYFENEAEPRVDATVAELRAGLGLFQAPLSRYEQSCWWSYVPLTFQKRLRILAKTDNFTHEGWPRLFFQVNYSPLDQRPETFPVTGSVDDKAALDAYAVTWRGARFPGRPSPALKTTSFSLEIIPGTSGELASLAGPGLIESLEIELPQSDGTHDADLRLFWDGMTAPSVDVPVDAFFGNIWQSVDFESKYLVVSNALRICRFPMPFGKQARLVLANRGSRVLTVKGRCRARLGTPAVQDAAYFHAAWNHTAATDRGRPHAVVTAEGRGKFVGCMLAISSAAPSWWALESDETMRVDGEAVPQWRGTGLEDYFNGAWYYKNNLARPLHGLIFKRPFVTVQYRFHDEDAVCFDRSIDVQFERGPDQASPAWMQSTAYYYLDQPHKAGSLDGAARAMAPPRDPFEKATLMMTLCNYERQGDYAGASRAIDDFLKRFPDVAFTAILRLRQVAYRERLEGYPAVADVYRTMGQGSENDAAASYARLLSWFHEDRSHALLSLYCGAPAQASIDGSPVLEASNPTAFMISPVRLSPGRHVLSVQTRAEQYPDWVQVCLRTHDGMVYSTPEWPFAFDPSGAWTQTSFDDSNWTRVGDSILEGPPLPPHIQTSAHPFVDMQALPTAIWVSGEWPTSAQRAVFRKVFDVSP